jgi:hypothetical protein
MTKAHITGFCQKYSVLKKNNTIYNLNIARQKTSKKMAKTPMAGLSAHKRWQKLPWQVCQSIKDGKNSHGRFVSP